MKKNLLLVAVVLFISLNAFPQATSLTIDNQTPGWLSSKINYGDQQTVRNLKVTGYINKTDLEFIGTLIQSRNLDGELDLSECNIIRETIGEPDNKLVSFGLDNKDSVRVYRIPKSVMEVENCTHKLYVDTLYFDCKLKYIDQSMLWYEKVDIGHLYLCETVDSIPDNAFVRNPGREWAGACTKIKSVHFSPSIKYIGVSAFEGCELYSCNFNDLVNLEYLGRAVYINGNWHTFGVCAPDTIRVPGKLKSYPLNAFVYKQGAHIFIDEQTKTLEGGTSEKYYYQCDGTGLTFHINQTTPPNITYWYRNSNWFPGATVYVPKGSKETYESSMWSATNIIEMNPIENIQLNYNEIILGKGQRQSFVIKISPADADDQRISWISENAEIASIDDNGVVTAINPGSTYIFATSIATGVKDSCKVTVIQPATGVTLSQSTYRLTNIGENFTLEATVLPADATNKEVRWVSSNESVCVVANGKVVATGFGTAVVMAVTVDGGFMATCTVIVEKEGISVTDVVLSQTEVKLRKGETKQLTATVYPSDATNKTVIWKSSDEGVCVVAQTGLLIARGEGVARVTVVPENGVGQAECDVTVVNELDAIQSVQSDRQDSDVPIYDILGRKVDQLMRGHLYIKNRRMFIAK